MQKRRRIRVRHLFPRRLVWLARISRAIDWLINLLKWPAAIASLLLLPFAVIASLRLLGHIWMTPTAGVKAFAVGLALYYVLWQLLLRRRIFGTFFSTLEHELTHAVVALATLHPVVGLRATFSRGGHLRYLTFGGNGNWLIDVAPYFVPTLSFALLAVLALLPADLRWSATALLGAVTAYHVTSTKRETHPGQTDLQKVGFAFSLMFLPAANVICFGVVIAFCHAGLAGVGRFFSDFGLRFW